MSLKGELDIAATREELDVVGLDETGPCAAGEGGCESLEGVLG